jgi:hypothetical protein
MAAALLVIGRGPDPEPGRTTPSARAEPHEQAPAADFVYVDGEGIDVDQVDPGALPDELATEEGGSPLLPAADLGWVDDLDDSALDRAETWLAKRRS